MKEISLSVKKTLPMIYQIANHLGVAVASKLIPLASIFLYSRYMTVHDYGVINLFTSYLWIFAIVMSLNLHTGIGRYIYNEDADFNSFLGTTLLAIGAIYLTAALVVIVRLESISQLLGMPRQVVLLMLAVVLGQIVESLFTQVAIFHQRSPLLLKVVASKAFATLALSMGLLLGMDSQKFLAVLYADAIASLVLVAYVLRGFRATIRWSFRIDHLRYMAGYSVPLIPYMLSLTLLSQFDRVMIDSHFGKEATGLYSLAYNVGILLLMVVTAVLNAYNPAFFSALNQKDYARVIKDSGGIFALAVLVTGVLVLFGPELAALVVPAKFASAFDLIPIVAIGGLCFVIFQIWVRVIAYAHRTYLISTIAIVAATINIGLNYWLLPIYGYKVAAVTTIVAYLAMSLLSVIALNYIVRLFRVNVWPDLLYMAGLAGVMLFFRSADLQPFVAYPLKAALLVLLMWQLKGKLIGLVSSRKASLTDA
jgi:O-antigen/teichoic acid export membrane protein